MSVLRNLVSPLLRSCRLTTTIGVQRNNTLLTRHINISPIVYSPVIPFNLPDVGEAIMTVIITEWLVKPGDTIAMGDPVCEVQSDKSSATIYCPHDGVVEKLMYEVDHVATKDEPLIMINVDSDNDTINSNNTSNNNDAINSNNTSTTDNQSIDTASLPNISRKVLATPAVRKIALENKIDLSDVPGTGKDNRVLKEDIINYLEQLKSPTEVRAPSIATPITIPTPSVADRVEPVKGFKSIMVQTMTRSGQIPQFGYCDEIPMDRLIEVRNYIKTILAEQQIKFSYMPLMIKAISLALNHYPILNAHVNNECTEITYKSDHNIGIAMDTPLGLVVPNVKSVQNKSLIEVTRDLNRIHDLSLKGQLSPAEIAGGTFSLSNIGAVGGTYTRPMLLPPEVCIGAFGKIQEVAKFDNTGNIMRSHVMYASWSADHRIIDGATVARFSNLWRSYLENPETMLVDLK